MFWDTKDPPSHNIEILLESPDTKLEVFLEEDNIIQECKTHKKNIVNYFTRPDVIRRMIELITTEPPEEVPIAERFRHANVACEILTMGLPSLDEKLLADADTLNTLYSYLENEPPLNPLLASFFSKTFSMFFTKKSEQDWFLYQQTCLKLLEYLKSRSNFLDLICKHFSTPIVPDLIIEMMQIVEGVPLRKSLYEWLSDERLVEKLIEIIGDPEQSEKHASVADFLCDLIHQGRTMRQNLDSFEPVFDGSDPILKKIESATTLLALFNVILQPNAVETAIVSGITVVLKIIKLLEMKDERDSERVICFLAREKEIHDEFLTTVIRVIEPQLKHFNDLLKNPPKKHDIFTSAANLSPPFGMARLQICRLFAELLQTQNDQILEGISQTDFLDVLLTLFKEYCWNNFLHTEVERCLRAIFPPFLKPKTNTNEDIKDNEKKRKDSLTEMLDAVLVPCLKDCNFFTPSAIQIYAVVDCKIISKLIDCWNTNKEMESAEKGRRLGYMGHLINILKHITNCISESIHIRALIESNLKDENERNLWQTIVDSTDGELTKALSQQTKLLANHKPCEYNVSLEFFTDNDISDAFNGLCSLMDSSDADVIFTLDYNTQHDDHDFDDDDGDEDYTIHNDNNEENNKDRRNDDVKNALNLFQFGSGNDDDEGDEDDNAAAACFERDSALSFYVEPCANPFSEDPWENNAEGNAINFDRAFADFESFCFGSLQPSNTNASTATDETTSVAPTSSEEYDNNANVEKSSLWSVDFTPFQTSKKDSQFTSNFVDDYEDDEGMWTKPLGASPSTTTIAQLEKQLNEPNTLTCEMRTNINTNGPCMLQDCENLPEDPSLNQLNNSMEDNSFIDPTPENIPNKEEVTKEINNDLNIKQQDEETTSEHKLQETLDTNNTETQDTNSTSSSTINQIINTATTAEEISDGSITATPTT